MDEFIVEAFKDWSSDNTRSWSSDRKRYQKNEEGEQS